MTMGREEGRGRWGELERVTQWGAGVSSKRGHHKAQPTQALQVSATFMYNE